MQAFTHLSSTLRTGLLIALTLLLCCPEPSFAAGQDRSFVDPEIMQQMLPKVSYSADRSMTVEGQTITSKVNYAPQMERNEMSFGGFSTVSITRYDQQLIWTTTPMGGVSEIKFNEAGDKGGKVDEEIEQIGTETLNGQSVKVYRYRRVNSDGERVEGKFYLSEDNIPLRTHMTYTDRKGKSTEMTLQLSNIKRGEQPASLFEKPQGGGGIGKGLKSLFKR